MSYRPIQAQKTTSVLQSNTSLQRLVARAQVIDHLQMLLNQYLQPAARECCRIAMYQTGTLTLIVSDGHWATRLRYQQKRLLQQLQDLPEFNQLLSIQFKVRPPTQHNPPPARTIELSEQAGQMIQSSAEATRDPVLREALERLAKHAKKP
ncbi:MAG TPA: DUF721 domain-containing protein [Gammaproteobacteria bacterium]|nr:DUF721 domain-containing protein [Gammaproteobacteria bacterium]